LLQAATLQGKKARQMEGVQRLPEVVCGLRKAVFLNSQQPEVLRF
jgi:hypothetical protein